jgi:integrase
MSSINQNTEITRNAKGKASIQVDKNSLRIRLPRHLYQGKQKFLSLGLTDTPQNRSKAEAKLVIIQRDIDYEEFDTTLDKYRPAQRSEKLSLNTENEKHDADSSLPKQLTLKEMLELFPEKYFLTRPKNRQSLRTLEQHEQQILRAFKFKENSDFYLTSKDIYEAIKLTKAGSSMRVKSVSSLKVFCEHFDINYVFKGLKNGYKPAPRKLPSDEEIIKGWHAMQIDKCPNNKSFEGNPECWAWIFAVIATYGLRPHEVLAIDYEKSFKPPHYPLYIDEELTGGTKTGSRISFPIPLDWVHLFDIANPKTSYLDKQKEYYLKNVRQFASTLAERRRYKGIKFQIYDLRHRYAIRGHELGFPIDDMARWMGHNVSMHTQNYQKYLCEGTHFIAYEDGLRRMEALQKIKDGCQSYAELEAQLEKANNRIVMLETELAFREVIVENKLLLSTQAQVSSEAVEQEALNKAPSVLHLSKTKNKEIANQLKLF